MRACLADGKIDPKDVGYINAHGTSTQQGDVAETEAVKAVFGEQARKLVFGSTKSHDRPPARRGGRARVRRLRCWPRPAASFRRPSTSSRPIRECDLDCAPNRKVERPVDVALSNSFGFGGHNVTLAVKRWEA